MNRLFVNIEQVYVILRFFREIRKKRPVPEDRLEQKNLDLEELKGFIKLLNEYIKNHHNKIISASYQTLIKKRDAEQKDPEKQFYYKPINLMTISQPFNSIEYVFHHDWKRNDYAARSK